MISPPPLKKGDKIALAAPARKVSPQELKFGVSLLKQKGFEVVPDENLFMAYDQFAGDDLHRTWYLQQLLDDPTIKAILFARGGYGSVRIVDRLDFSRFIEHPKWLAGYSDITVFLNHVNRLYGIETLHAPMPFGFDKNTSKSLQSLFGALAGKPEPISWPTQSLSRKGIAKGTLVGGNLSVLYSLLGSRSFPETSGSILFIEDLDEYLYHIDRMMVALKRAGKLKNLAGLVVGGMNDMNDNTVPFGKTAEEIIWEAVGEFDFPVAFQCPVGHIADNRTLVMGRKVKLEVGDLEIWLRQ
jgi:muramoyltetrapeptide carboxypeptidase